MALLMTDIYADLDTLAKMYESQHYSEELAWEMAFAKCEQNEEDND